jgi:hypothetical protein
MVQPVPGSEADHELANQIRCTARHTRALMDEMADAWVSCFKALEQAARAWEEAAPLN